MKKIKVKYTDKPIGDFKLMNDFLPPPEKLVMKEETVHKSLVHKSLGEPGLFFCYNFSHGIAGDGDARDVIPGSSVARILYHLFESHPQISRVWAEPN